MKLSEMYYSVLEDLQLNQAMLERTIMCIERMAQSHAEMEIRESAPPADPAPNINSAGKQP